MCSQLLVCFEGASGRNRDGELFSEAWISCVAMTASSNELSTGWLQSAGMQEWKRPRCVSFAHIDPCRPDMLVIRRIAACVNTIKP